MTNVTHNYLLCLVLFLTPYMFRARRAHHQERQIVSIQPLVSVTLCWWPGRHGHRQHTRKSASGWLLTRICDEMHGQQNIKKKKDVYVISDRKSLKGG
jgi:hypothetical protein